MKIKKTLSLILSFTMLCCFILNTHGIVKAEDNLAQYENNANIIRVSYVYFKEDLLELNIGENHKMTVYIGPPEATNKELTWSSSDESVAVVDQNGKVTAVNPGVATIFADTVQAELYAICVVNVFDPNLSSENYALSAISSASSVYYDQLRPSNANDGSTETLWMSHPDVRDTVRFILDFGREVVLNQLDLKLLADPKGYIIFYAWAENEFIEIGHNWEMTRNVKMFYPHTIKTSKIAIDFNTQSKDNLYGFGIYELEVYNKPIMINH